jgi:hypothetical protein
MEIPLTKPTKGADMNEEKPELEQLRAFTYGMQAAFIAALGAVIRTHPNPKALAEMLEAYYQREQTYLENKPFPEHVLDSFQQMWKRVEIEIQHALQYDQQQPPVQE